MDEGKPGAGRGGALTVGALAESPNWVDVNGLYVQEGMLAFAVLQFLLGIAGTIALIVTLRESRRATATALKALHVQQSAERAVLVISEVRPLLVVPAHLRGSLIRPANEDPIIRLSARVKFKNRGRSIALIKSSALSYSWGVAPMTPNIDDAQTTREHAPLDEDEEITLRSEGLTISEAEYMDVKNAGGSYWFYGHICYDDVFGERHMTSFAYERPLEGPQSEFGGEQFWRMS